MQLRETEKKHTWFSFIFRAILLLCKISIESEAFLLKFCRYVLVMQGIAVCHSTPLLLCYFFFLLYISFCFWL